MNQEETDTLNGCCGVFCLAVAIAVCIVSFLAVDNHLCVGLILLLAAAIVGVIGIAFLFKDYLEKKDSRQTSEDALIGGERAWLSQDIQHFRSLLSKLQEGISVPNPEVPDYDRLNEACRFDLEFCSIQLPTDENEPNFCLKLTLAYIKQEIRQVEIWQELLAEKEEV